MLRAYMHGFFVDARLWKRANALVSPFAYEQYRAERVAAKLEAERKTRITVERKVVTASPPAIGSYAGHVPPPLLRLVPAPGIYRRPSAIGSCAGVDDAREHLTCAYSTRARKIHVKRTALRCYHKMV
eukprot:1192402-Prorocentrum_minimum.AAC.1